MELTLVAAKGGAEVSRVFDFDEVEDIAAAIEDALTAIVTGGKMEKVV